MLTINYGVQNWKRTRSLYNFIEKNTYYSIVDLACYGKNSKKNSLFYSNNLLNQIKREEFGIIDFVFSLNNIFVEEKYIIDFVNNIYPLFAFDYGYAFYLEENKDIGTEQKVKKSLFSNSVSVTKAMIDEYKKLQNVTNGYLPELRKFNILNEKQISQSNITCGKRINEKLFFYAKD